MVCDKLCGDVNCEPCLEKSFASVVKSKHLHDKSINILLLPKNRYKTYLFDCDKCCHVFDMTIAQVTLGTWCNYCSNRKLCNDNNCTTCFNKSFASHEKSQFWSKSNNIIPRQVFKNTHDKYIFNCDKCDHSFSQKLGSTTKGAWCPFCAHLKLCDDKECKSCFDKSFASHSKSIYWNDKNICKPRQVFKNSNTPYLFDCNICDHVISIGLASVSADKWCLFCANQKLCNNQECDKCFNKSFASHAKHIYWSENNSVKPREVFKKTTKKYLFRCGNCKHEFDAQISGVNNGEWCPFCAVPAKRLCSDMNCDQCFNRSFASHEASKFWSDSNDMTPRQVLKFSNKKYSFYCNDCSHEYQSQLSNKMQGGSCPYCSSQSIILCTDENCKHCFNKSFASCDKSIFWSNKNTVKPRSVIKGTHSKFWFDCHECSSSFEASLSNVSNRRWCPKCKNKTEKILLQWLHQSYNVKHHVKYDWCVFEETNKMGEYDFVIEDSKIIIELDGDQHFKIVDLWKSCPIENQKKDVFKMKCANVNGYTVIRLLQSDVYFNKNNWELMLSEALNKNYTTPSCVFLSSDDIYKSHVEQMQN